MHLRAGTGAPTVLHMSVIDVDNILTPVSEENPCGDDLEYDAEFQAMERASQGKPEQQMGDTVVPAEPPDWPELFRASREILLQSKDMRAAAFLARAAARTDGWAGFSEGLVLMRRLIETYWDDLHPKLDPDDDNDPTFRMNVLESLTDREGTLLGLRAAPLVESRMLGRFGLWEIDVAQGEATLPADFEGEPPTMERIRGAFQEVEVSELTATSDAVGAAIEAVEGIDAYLSEKLEPGSQVDLSPLQDCLKGARKVLTEALAERGVGEADAGEEGSAEGEASSGPAESVPGAINSWDDVIRTIDRICDFYQRTEPASPVPLLLRRAQGLVKLDFLEIMEELAPGGMSEAAQVLKTREEQNS